MAAVCTFKAFALFLVLAIFSLAASAQEFSPASSPAPAPDAGAAGSVSCSTAMIGASIVLSLMAALKNKLGEEGQNSENHSSILAFAHFYEQLGIEEICKPKLH
ncbi:hypothetical protein VNO77_39492 [Canavalia gladiata]|uniref:Uncharacterized protein n=1 Tax=Canavalia gladiata TaxID=3824 RepID=A0AAN9KDI0_CANGL